MRSLLILSCVGAVGVAAALALSGCDGSSPRDSPESPAATTPAASVESDVTPAYPTREDTVADEQPSPSYDSPPVETPAPTREEGESGPNALLDGQLADGCTRDPSAPFC